MKKLSFAVDEIEKQSSSVCEKCYRFGFKLWTPRRRVARKAKRQIKPEDINAITNFKTLNIPQ